MPGCYLHPNEQRRCNLEEITMGEWSTPRNPVRGASPPTAEEIFELRATASGSRPGDVAIRNGQVVFVHSGEVRPADIVTRGRHIAEGQCCFQISQAGNIRSASPVIEFARKYDKLDRVLLSSDTPTGTGVMPLGTLKSIVEMGTMTGLEAGEAWALATGHNAAVLRQNTGRIAPGLEADLVVMDAPTGSAYPDARAAICGGDLPGISAVMIDGEIKALRSRNTPLATRLCEVREQNGVERLPAKSARFLT